MITPTFAEFKRLASRGNLIAVRAEHPADLETPVSAFLKLELKEPYAFLLESAEQEERVGRYSFLGFSPEAVFTAKGGSVFYRQGNRTRRVGPQDELLEILRGALAPFRLANPENVPAFSGGLVGFFGYENIRLFDRVSLQEKNGLPTEDSVFFVMREFLFFDHLRKTLSFVLLVDAGGHDLAKLKRRYHAATRRLTALQAKLCRPLHRHRMLSAARPMHPIRANLSRPEFLRRIRRIKEYIRAGDCIQVVFSQRLGLGRIRDDFQVYRALRTVNPSPYMFYFRYGPLRLIGSSPEVLVKKIGRTAQVRPIAGTRPRNPDTVKDLRLEENLKRSVKEMAEHLMLVDLGRNDLGRVCDFKSVRVEKFARVERYSHVMHLVSTVTGRLRPGKDAFDLLRSTFPAGTVTGAPKIRAMEIIDELEPERRGPYAGSLGYFSFNHDMDMCITIRTIVVMEENAYVQAGAGVVHDSRPKREYEETMNKAGALIQAVRHAAEGAF